jgi:hypothetical protein
MVFMRLIPPQVFPLAFSNWGGGWPIAPESTRNIAFFVTKYVFQERSNYTLALFDMTHFIPLTEIPFSTVQNGLGRLGRFIRRERGRLVGPVQLLS